MAEKYDVIGEVRGRGAMIAIELVKSGTKEPNPEATAALAKACHAEGLLVLTTGTYGNVLRFLPPLVIGEDLLNEGLDIIEAAFAAGSELRGHGAREFPGTARGAAAAVSRAVRAACGGTVRATRVAGGAA